jgi:glycosyltransferase involved in cell wall biosynthesis
MNLLKNRNKIMTNPLISVIIPTNNEGRDGRLHRAIESMCLQTYHNLEILVIDDHSTDNTKEVVEKFIKKDPRVQYHLLPYEDSQRIHILPHRTLGWRSYDINGGYLARNYGFSIARGEYIVLQDADDASFANRIEVQYNLAKKYGATLVAIQWMQLKNDYVDKQLDVDKIFSEIGEKNIVIRPETITEIARTNKGVLMNDWFPHHLVPFFFKWFPLTRPLFFAGFDSYPGADNSVLFEHKVIEKVLFRKRDNRVWPNPYGRGSGRDFAFQVAETFKNSWSFRLPLYLWHTTSANPNFIGYEKYIR